MVSTGGGFSLPKGEDFTFGHKQVTTAGTAVQLKTSSTPLRGGVFIRVNNFDTAGDIVYVGVSDGVSATTGFMVDVYYPCWLEIDDLSDVWIDASHDAVGVSFMAV